MNSPPPKRQRDLVDRIFGFVVGFVFAAAIIVFIWARILSAYL